MGILIQAAGFAMVWDPPASRDPDLAPFSRDLGVTHGPGRRISIGVGVARRRGHSYAGEAMESAGPHYAGPRLDHERPLIASSGIRSIPPCSDFWSRRGSSSPDRSD